MRKPYQLGLSNDDKDKIYKFRDENEGVEIYKEYSGRGMYGDTCVGLSLEEDSDYDVFSLGVAIGKLNLNIRYFKYPEDLNVCVDSLGKGKIVYFPNIVWWEDADEN